METKLYFFGSGHFKRIEVLSGYIITLRSRQIILVTVGYKNRSNFEKVGREEVGSSGRSLAPYRRYTSI